MYRYDTFDQAIVDRRVAQFRDQTRRFLDGQLTEDEFRPLRLRNGLYIQKHAPMLRISIPYGLLSSAQLRVLAQIARQYDRGYGHFTTRQNIQFNWPRLEDVPEILALLATVQMHAIQTSGNCVRNITSDPFAGVARDEVIDPRPWAELVRQWATLNPEFSFLPRKFKIAVSGSTDDRTAMLLHDIGVQAVRNPDGEVGFRVAVGGGQGRTPMIGRVIREFLPGAELLNYFDAILRVYNRYGRRDNLWKARIKILVKELTPAEFTRQVEAEWETIRGGPGTVPPEEIERLAAHFVDPSYREFPRDSVAWRAALADSRPLSRWASRNVRPHKRNGYAAVTLSLKRTGTPPGDATAEEMEAVADLADRYSFGEIRVTHEQNLALVHVRKRDLYQLWQGLVSLGLATANIGLATDIIACPGLDYCSLANARSIPVAQRISLALQDSDRLTGIGELKIKISGCINACGHHHVGHIGILGVDKKGEEFYQITLGGSADETAAIGEIIGPAFSSDRVVWAVETIVETYLKLRRGPEERFLDAYRRVGPDPFKETLYATH